MDEAVGGALSILGEQVGDLAGRLSPVYLLSCVAIAYVLYRRLRGAHGRGFWSWLLPRQVWSHPSHVVDLKIFVFGRLIAALGVFNRLALGTAVSAATIALLAGLFGDARPEATLSLGQTAVLTLVFAAVADFSTYWVHRLHHETPALWPFHAVHHSAEVLTPLTLYRKHPVYDLLSSLLRGLLVGMATGIVVFALFGKVGVLALGGANLVYCAFNFVGANLRHSHVWLSYGRLLERVFISPAQHQIHHSRAPIHHDRNYGEIFALWDWMFGTLYLPRGRESFEIGLADPEGKALPQPHPSLRAALLVPFAQSWRALRPAKKSAARSLEEAA